MYETFVAVQEDLYNLEQSEDKELEIETRLIVLHYLMNRLDEKEKKDVSQFLTATYSNYKFLAEEMKKNYIQEDNDNGEIFQMSRPTDSVN